jgi:hypothetical protein
MFAKERKRRDAQGKMQLLGHRLAGDRRGPRKHFRPMHLQALDGRRARAREGAFFQQLTPLFRWQKATGGRFCDPTAIADL